MSYIVLARKYRPQTFAEVYAQEHVTDILINAINSNRVNHAYLFNGPRGVGKTSLARILAKSLNCEKGPTTTPCNVCSNCMEITSSTSTDVIEIDGASNNGVDDIRELQEELMYPPAHSNYKIYIIDEVHMLSKSAFNALLKTLEEPPENVVFIFATTEPHKVPPTIISRCQRYDFKRIPVDSIVKRIKELAAEEHVSIDDESIFLIARKADGGLRDALSLMDQVLSYCMNEVTIDKVREIFGLLPNQVFKGLLQNIRNNESQALIMEIQKVFEQGTELQEFLNNSMDFLRIVLLRQVGISPSEISKDEYPLYDEISAQFSRSELLYIISALMQCKQDIRSSTNPQLILEVVLIKLSRMDEMNEISQIITKLDSIKISGASQPAPVQSRVMADPVSKPVYNKPAEQPVQELPPEPEALEACPEFNEASLKQVWPRLIAKVKKAGTGIVPISLSQAQIIEVKECSFKLQIRGLTYYTPLNKSKELVESILKELFGKAIRLELELMETEAPQTVQIKRKSLDDLKAENPGIQEYLELTKSRLIQS
ncbi:MAG TPA: DNA polymerase III subunit gamma/tau [Candidatus Cloacimonadota bacterium]|nr:DNA polymerase III subunit gamma/tau [Candidatus Cloacimonadota bacterium]